MDDQPIDPFFEQIADSHGNACIGRQGDEQDYMDGFTEAALRLADAAIADDSPRSRDLLAMPILFSARHGLELSLKFATAVLHDAGAVPHGPEHSHDVVGHWRRLVEARVGDHALRTLLHALEPYVLSLGSVNEDGQALRFARSTGGERSLPRLGTVHLPLVRHSLGRMAELLGRLRDRALGLERELRSGIFTRECSRSDLVQIAGMVGPRNDWGSEAFLTAKQVALRRYELSGSGFSRALHAIQKSPQLASMIGVERRPLAIGEDKLVRVLDLWSAVHQRRREDRSSQVHRLDFEQVREELERQTRLDAAVMDQLDDRELADLAALFYLGRDHTFGDGYERLFEERLAIHAHQRRSVLVHDLLSKRTLLDGVARGIKISGMPTLAARLGAPG